MAQYRGKLAFAVPATNGTYAPDLSAAFLAYPKATAAASDPLLGVTAVLEPGFPAAAQVELWLLDVTAADPTNASNYVFGFVLLTAAGAITQALASYPGALIRVKSGGTAGTATVMFSAD